MASDHLLQEAAKVVILDTAGRIIGGSDRAAATATSAEVLALALATESFWAVCLEADLLVRTLAMPDGPARNHAVQTQAGIIRRLFEAFSNPEQEKPHGSGHS